MLIDDVNIKLKDGREAVIRCGRENDIPGILDYLNISAAETEFIIRYPEECGRYTYEAEKQFIESCNSSSNHLMLVCEIEGKIAGNCEMVWSNYMKTRHRAQVAIGLISEFWGLGIGTAMFLEMIHIAEKDPEITQLELDFVEGNTRARALYEKMGFRICGVKPNAIRLKNGTLLNEYSMIRPVEH